MLRADAPTAIGRGRRIRRARPLAARPMKNYHLNSTPRMNPEADYRKSLFTYLGIALKYRWLILTFCGVGLATGYIVNFTSDPNLSGNGDHPDRPASAEDCQRLRMREIEIAMGMIFVFIRPNTIFLEVARWRNGLRRISILRPHRTF